MNRTTTYSEKLKDPRWQKKRLEIFQRDNFRCRSCSSEVNTLSVHHLSYKRNPWESSDEELVTLCDSCHKLVEDAKKAICSKLHEASFRFAMWSALELCKKRWGADLLRRTAGRMASSDDFANIVHLILKYGSDSYCEAIADAKKESSGGRDA